MGPKLACVILFLSGLLGIVCCSNILLVPLSGDGSHYSVMLNVAETLMHHGHNIITFGLGVSTYRTHHFFTKTIKAAYSLYLLAVDNHNGGDSRLHCVNDY